MSQSRRPLLPDDAVHPAARDRMARHHEATLREVEEAVARDDVVVVGMAQNPHVKRARKALAAAGVPFTYLEYGSYLSAWQPRLAIKMWSGWPTFPQVFVRGQLIGGANDTQKLLESGELPRLLAAAPATDDDSRSAA